MPNSEEEGSTLFSLGSGVVDRATRAFNLLQNNIRVERVTATLVEARKNGAVLEGP